MRQLNIGVFGARAVPSTYSGYETFLTTLLPELAARGHRVTMYCRTGEVVTGGDYLGVRRVVLPAIPGKQFNTLSHGAVASIRARVARHDVVLAVNVANALFCALHRYTGRSIVLNTDGQEWLRGKWGRAGRGFFLGSARCAGRSATALVSDCEAMAAIYRDEFGADSTVIPYSVPATPARATAVCARLGVERAKYFVVAARLNPENNVDTVAEAYSRTTIDAPLLVLGAANYHSPVEEKLKAVAAADPRVRLVGHVDDRDEFFDLLGNAAAYIHGHSVGGMNPSLVEAMHAGAMIVALDTEFNRETLGPTGTFFELATLGAQLCEIVATSSEVDAARRAAAQHRAAERFNVDDVVSAYEALLRAAALAPARRTLSIPTRWAK